MDYLRLKIVSAGEEECHRQEAMEDEKQQTSENEKSETGNEDDDVIEKNPDDLSSENCVTKASYTLKMRGVPFEADEEDIRTFFYPLNLRLQPFECCTIHKMDDLLAMPLLTSPANLT